MSLVGTWRGYRPSRTSVNTPPAQASCDMKHKVARQLRDVEQATSMAYWAQPLDNLGRTIFGQRWGKRYDTRWYNVSTKPKAQGASRPRSRCPYHVSETCLCVEIRLEEEGDAVAFATQLVHNSVHRRSEVVISPAKEAKQNHSADVNFLNLCYLLYASQTAQNSLYT